MALLASLTTAEDQLRSGHVQGSIGNLRDFIVLASAQSGKKIDSTLATSWIDEANRILSLIQA